MLGQILLWKTFEMSNKLNKIWLKGLNSRISEDEWLNCFKVSIWVNSKIHLKLSLVQYQMKITHELWP